MSAWNPDEIREFEQAMMDNEIRDYEDYLRFGEPDHNDPRCFPPEEEQPEEPRP